MDQPLCRICRGESTDSEPLYHPCKCKGSIKYIHQNCLMEWLKHSNKSTKQCDICNTQYKFRTIYDPNMPKRIPFISIFQKLLTNGYKKLIQLISIVFYLVFVVIMVPVIWKFVARSYTWIIEGNLPAANPKFFDALMYGETALKTAESSYISLIKGFAEHTYFSGLRYIFVFVIVHLALFVEHEWVVRDEGYTKLLLRKMGREPKAKLADMFQNALNGLRQDARDGNGNAGDVVNRIDLIADALQNLNNDHNQDQDNADPAQNADNIVRFWQQAGDRDEINDQDTEGAPQGTEDEIQPIGEPVQEADPAQAHNLARDPFAPVEVPHVLDAVQQQLGPNLRAEVREGHDASGEDSGEEDPFQNVADEEAIERMVDEVFEAQVNENNIFTILGLTLDLKAPIFVMALCNMIISVYLAVVYLVPSILGTVVLRYVPAPFIKLGAKFSKKFEHSQLWNLQAQINAGADWVSQQNKVAEFLVVIIKNFIKETLIFMANITGIEGATSADNTNKVLERTTNLVVGYSLLALFVYNLMASITRSGNPLTGSDRKIYSLLFEAVSTFKVFSIFAIEIFFFPVYCGWLLDFCIAPILLDSFYKDGQFTVLFTSSSSFLAVDYIRTALYWAFGTLYMLLFALFVGMIRSKILRPGVLFFIRSPDDPNARLIHDALMKPLGLQLSRIFLSAKVYTAFVLVGIGGITWGLRFLLTENGTSTLLPVAYHHYNDAILAFFVISIVMSYKDVIVKYVERYWRYAFELSCHTLRLSHFILGKPVAQERGYIIYRNWIEQIKGTAVPDYSAPKTYREAMRLFETTDTKCFFVPNGNYVRVPDNDTISKGYVKQLFVNVTKDDRLLARDEPAAEDTTAQDDEGDDTDEEYTSENNYTVVYKPPMLKMRCFQLVLLLWLFAVVLILMVILLALALGRPVTKFVMVLDGSLAFVLGGNKKDYAVHLQKYIDSFEWRYADMRSVCVGVLLQLFAVVQYDRKQADAARRQREGAAGEQNEAAEGNNAGNGPVPALFAGLPAFNNRFTREQNNRIKLLVFVSKFIAFIWVAFVHAFVIDLSYKAAHGISLFPFENLCLNGETVAYHLLASPFTVYPAMKYKFGNELANLSEFDIKTILPIVDLPRNLIRLGVIVACVGFYMSSQRWEAGPAVFLAYVTASLTHKVISIIKKYDLEIRNEKYVRGRALENVD